MTARFPICELGDVAELYDSLHQTPQYSDEGYPMIRVTDIRRGLVDTSGAVRVDEETYMLFSKKHRPQIGDILFSRVGSYGNSAFVNRNEEFCLGQNTVCITPEKSRIHPTFLYCALNSEDLRNQIESLVGGASQGTISLKNIRKLQVPIPPLPIQQRIASILSAYDELIENNQRRIKILETMARNLYREWFVHFRFPGHENHPRVDSQLGEIPLGWEARALMDLCSRITDGSHFSPPSVDDGYPMASVKDMHDWGIKLESCRRITSDDYENLVRNDCKPLKNDILIAKDGSYLKHTFVVGEEQDLVILSSIAMLRPNSSIRPNYLCFTLRDPVTKARMKGIVSGVAVPRIVLKDFRNFQILVPTQEIQVEWARIVDPLAESCRILVSQTENLRQTRDLLLPRLLSGQITLPEAVDDLTQVTSHA